MNTLRTTRDRCTAMNLCKYGTGEDWQEGFRAGSDGKCIWSDGGNSTGRSTGCVECSVSMVHGD